MKFQSSIAVFAVCPFCRSMVVLKFGSVEKMGEVAELAPDKSPLQIGTRGEWKGQSFELIGRIRMRWDQGSWTEWCALFPGEQIGWVAETQGFFMVTALADVADELPREVGKYKAGHTLRLHNHAWQIADVKEVTTIGGDGELPYPAPPGLRRVNADISGSGRACGTIEFHEDGPVIYLGEYAEFADLRFTHLRSVPGWDAEAEQVKHQTTALNCLNCGAVVEMRAAGLTQAAVCGSCGTVIDTADTRLRVIQKADEAIKKLRPLLPIGTRGKLDGCDWEVIGMQNRGDKYCSWNEYLLFNPWNGFRWLVTFGGHWTLVRQVPGNPDRIAGNSVHHGKSRYELFSRENAVVLAVLGEFYWKIERGEVAQVSDYISPPRILSKESYPGLNEATWSEGEYVEPEVVAEAFGVKESPARSGIYLNQPNPWDRRWKGVAGWALLFVSLFCAIQFMFFLGEDRKPFWRESFIFDRSLPNKIATTSPFSLRAEQPVSVGVYADVDNSWIGFDAELVNAKTNQAYVVGIGVEYYHGYEDGEYWTEGSNTTRVVIPSVPPGEYFLNLDPEADPAIQKVNYTVAVRPAGLFWSNFWLGLLLLAAYPIYVYWRRHLWEMARWAESDFNPYEVSSSDD